MKIRITTHIDFPELETLDPEGEHGMMHTLDGGYFNRTPQRYVLERFQQLVEKATPEALATWFILEDVTDA